jgi:hypothetical protein
MQVVHYTLAESNNIKYYLYGPIFPDCYKRLFRKSAFYPIDRYNILNYVF